MQLDGKSGPATLVDLRRGQQAVVAQLDVPDDIARRLMELGFLPGGNVRAGRAAPGGCPRVYEVDGSEVALRCDTARKIRLENAQAPNDDSR
jgi:ferrous iron transport protein A